MGYKLNFEAFSDNFSLPRDIIDDEFDKLDATYLKVIMLVFKNAGKHYSVNLLSNLLGVTENKISDAIAYWIQKGLLCSTPAEQISGEVVVLPKMAPASPPPIRITGNGELSYLLECMETKLGRPVTSVEHKTILHILEYIRLPADVIIMAIEYCVSVGKFNARYLEKVCVAWADKGINCHELAEQYLQILKASRSNEQKVKKILGIGDRNLIESEKEHINRWCIELGYDLDVIELAYERTIGSIQKLSFPYMNKILTSWKEKGYTSLENILQNENIPGKKRTGTSYDIEEIDRFWDVVPKLG